MEENKNADLVALVRDLYSIRSKVSAVLAENDEALSLEDIHGLAQI